MGRTPVRSVIVQGVRTYRPKLEAAESVERARGACGTAAQAASREVRALAGPGARAVRFPSRE